MKCKINYFEKRDRSEQGLLPYYLIRAKGTQGDASADVFSDDGTINFAAVQSRTFNFTKCLFPGSEEQCAALEAGFEVDDNNNVTNDRYINLTLFQWDTGKHFHIYQNGELLTETVTKEVEKIAEKPMSKHGKTIPKGGKYIEYEEVQEPRVFTRISLTLLCNSEGESVENNGEAPEAIARRNFETGLANGIYELCD